MSLSVRLPAEPKSCSTCSPGRSNCKQAQLEEDMEIDVGSRKYISDPDICVERGECLWPEEKLSTSRIMAHLLPAHPIRKWNFSREMNHWRKEVKPSTPSRPHKALTSHLIECNSTKTCTFSAQPSPKRKTKPTRTFAFAHSPFPPNLYFWSSDVKVWQKKKKIFFFERTKWNFCHSWCSLHCGHKLASRPLYNSEIWLWYPGFLPQWD